MKNIFLMIAVLLLWVGSVNAGVLKVKVPVDEFEQMQSRIETLKVENNKLKQEVKSYAVPAGSDNSVKATEMQALIDSLEKENNQLKGEVTSLAKESSTSDTEVAKEMNSRIDSLGRENRSLKRKVSSLKEKGMVLNSDSRTAQHIYFETNKKSATHIFE